MLLSIAERLELRKHHPCQHFHGGAFQSSPGVTASLRTRIDFKLLRTAS